jgi:hypothetical protein
MIRTLFLRLWISAMCLFCTFFNSLQAQIEPLGYYELALVGETDNARVIPVKENGVFIISEQSNKVIDTLTVEITHLDNDFKVKWTNKVRLSNDYYIVAAAAFGHVSYVILKDSEDVGNTKLLIADTRKDSIEIIDVIRLNSIKVAHFSAIKSSVIIAGELNGRPCVFVYDFEAERLQVLKDIYEMKGEIIEVKINKDESSFNVLLATIDDKNDRTIAVHTYDHEATLIRAYQLETAALYQLVNGASSSFGDLGQVVVGLYSHEEDTDPSGFYVNFIDKANNQRMQYLPFGEFDSFFKHEGEKKANKQKEKSLNGQKRGKPIEFRSEFMLNRLVERDGEIIVSAEFFKTLSSPGDINEIMRAANPVVYGGRFVPDNASESDKREIEFTHAFVFALDESGELKWDHNYEIDEKVENVVSSYGAFQYDQTATYFAHFHGQELVVESMTAADQALRASMKLPQQEKDKVRFDADDYGIVIQWQTNKYIVFGTHHVRSAQRTASDQKVFFVNGLEAGGK